MDVVRKEREADDASMLTLLVLFKHTMLFSYWVFMVLILRGIRRHDGLCYLGENADDVTGFTAPITVSVDDVVTFELDETASNI